MAANLLNSEQAVQVSVEVVRAFVRLRTMVLTNSELAKRLDELDLRLSGESLVRTNCTPSP
ncbi:MAG TPA: hypothetical protein VIX17_11890 [Pyrinomonadaceae bacterium]